MSILLGILFVGSILPMQSCSRKIYPIKEEKKQDSIIIIKEVVKEVVKDSIIEIHIEKEIEKNVTRDTISNLENKMAKSTAMVSDGFLHHSLETKEQDIEETVVIKEVHTSDTVVIETIKEEVIVNEVNVLNSFQKFLLYSGIAFWACLGFAVVRKFLI